MAAPPGPNRRTGWSPRQLFTRIAAIFAIGALIVVLHFTGLLDTLQQRLFPPAVDWSHDYSVVEHLRRLVVQKALTSDRKECLLFVINGNDPPEAQRMQVWEKHTGGCPGTRGQLPVLFTLRVDRDRHSVQTDQGSPGHFHALP